MQAKVDSVGRVLIPKKLREALGLRAGSTVDVSWYGAGLQIVPHGRTARIIEENGRLIATGDARITDEIMYALIDAGRR